MFTFFNGSTTVAKEKLDFSRHSDSFLTHFFARSISVYITPRLANTRTTPLQVTIVGLILGLCAAGIGSVHSWYCGLLAAFLIESSHVLDCVDGELARLTGRGNPFAAAMDPITDRIKDMALLFSAYFQALNSTSFNLSDFQISAISFCAIGFWLLYLYVVDAFLNPAKRKKATTNSLGGKLIYLGLYDLFIYGSIVFFVFQVFHYFIFFIFLISIVGFPVQIIRLKNYLH